MEKNNENGMLIPQTLEEFASLVETGTHVFTLRQIGVVIVFT